jgi:hypothetical protein
VGVPNKKLKEAALKRRSSEFESKRWAAEQRGRLNSAVGRLWTRISSLDISCLVLSACQPRSLADSIDSQTHRGTAWQAHMFQTIATGRP